jgi:nitronate monooxygenase
VSFPEPDDFRAELRKCSRLTGGRPFGVNLSVSRRPGANERLRAHVDILVEEGVRFVETSGNDPTIVLERLKSAGVVVMHKVPAVRYALSAQKLGVDAIGVVGAECGGHPGVHMIGTMVQVPAAAAGVGLPLAVGGGIGTGSQLASALAMGADAVIVGTRFLVAEEIWAHRRYKERVVEGDGLDSRVVMASMRANHRVLDNASARAVADLERDGKTDFEAYRPHVEGALARRAYETGDWSRGMLDYGQAACFADRIEPVEDIVDRLLDGALDAVARLARLRIEHVPYAQAEQQR